MNFKADPKTDGGGDFLKIKDKESIVGVFRGDPLEYYAKWDGKKSSRVDASDPSARFRFRVNFIVNIDGALKSLIWEQGPIVYNLLKSVNADYVLEKHFMKITRKGSTMNDTEYMIIPVPNGAVTAEKESLLSSVPMQDLNTGFEAAPTFAPPSSVNVEDELPF